MQKKPLEETRALTSPERVRFLKLSNGKTETEVQIPKKETKGTLVQLANSSACERTVLLRYW